jgi:hypothetical protein
MFISTIPMGRWNSRGAGGIHIRSWLSRGFTNGTVPLGRRMRQMIALKTSASSGLINISRSASVFDDALCSSGSSSPVLGRRHRTRL